MRGINLREDLWRPMCFFGGGGAPAAPLPPPPPPAPPTLATPTVGQAGSSSAAAAAAASGAGFENTLASSPQGASTPSVAGPALKDKLGA